MLEFYYQLSGKRRKRFRVTGSQCTIGSARGNDLVLRTRDLAKRHAVIRSQHNELFLKDLGSAAGCWVNDVRVMDYGPLLDVDDIRVGDLRLQVHAGKPESPLLAEPVQSDKGTLVPDSGHSSQNPKANETVNGATTESVEEQASEEANEALNYWGRVVHKQLLQQMDLHSNDVNRMSDEHLREESSRLIQQIISSLHAQFPSTLDIERLQENVLNESVGLGPLEQFLQNPQVSEIMVNSCREIFVERHGRLERTDCQFSSNETVRAVIDRIITPLGKRIDESTPIVDSRLKDGSRVNAVIPPLVIKGPCLTIRKFPTHRLEFSDLVSKQVLSPAMVEFLRVCVESRRNMVIAGGTGTGKTTLLNVLSRFIPCSERIVTIEDAAELKLVQPNLVSMEARPANPDGNGEVQIRDLVKNSLRMRPDRIVVGECRGGEALDMLQAMNTGHDGSLTTLHANTPRDALSRLEVMVLMAGMDIPVTAIREQMSSAIDIVVQMKRFACGARKITKITEIVGMESGTVQCQDLFQFIASGHSTADSAGPSTQGRFTPTGAVPVFFESLREAGQAVEHSLFAEGLPQMASQMASQVASQMAIEMGAGVPGEVPAKVNSQVSAEASTQVSAHLSTEVSV